jgi:Transposase DDE domain
VIGPKGVGKIGTAFIAHRQKETLDSLQKGEIESIRVSQKLPVDQIAAFALGEGFLQAGLKKFPDPRSQWEVPIEVLLLPQILQRLNDEHSLLLAPYMLNSADLVMKLGYNVRILTEGFNKKNVYPRETPFHGETLKHLLLGMKPEQLIKWFNSDWLPIWRENSPGRTQQYILDGTKIEVPGHLAKKYKNCGCVENPDGTFSYGYKAVWLQEIIDRKGVIVSMKIVPIQVHDLQAARGLIDEFPFEEGATLIADRGFIDGKWITHLKQDRKVDLFIPLKRNMDATQAAIAQADHRGLWKNHPTREKQKIAEFTSKDGGLFWKECPVLSTGVLARWTQKDGAPAEVLFVTTKEKQTGKSILAVYDQRAEIEESHRQLKENQGIEKLPSKKFVHVVFRIIMGVIGFNLMNLFLNSENCATFEEFSLKTLRQKRMQEENPKVIVYAKETFAILRLMEFLPLILHLEDGVRKKLSRLFKNLDLSPAPR